MKWLPEVTEVAELSAGVHEWTAAYWDGSETLAEVVYVLEISGATVRVVPFTAVTVWKEDVPPPTPSESSSIRMWSPTAKPVAEPTITVSVASEENVVVAGVPWATTNPNSPDRPDDAAIDSVADEDVAANDATDIASPPTMPMRASTRAFL